MTVAEQAKLVECLSAIQLAAEVAILAARGGRALHSSELGGQIATIKRRAGELLCGPGGTRPTDDAEADAVE